MFSNSTFSVGRLTCLPSQSAPALMHRASSAASMMLECTWALVLLSMSMPSPFGALKVLLDGFLPRKHPALRRWPTAESIPEGSADGKTILRAAGLLLALSLSPEVDALDSDLIGELEVQGPIPRPVHGEVGEPYAPALNDVQHPPVRTNIFAVI